MRQLSFIILILTVIVSELSSYPLPYYPTLSPSPSATPEDSTEGNESFIQKNQPKTKFLNDPKTVKKEVKYDIETDKYIVTEKVGDKHVKPPMYLTFEEYMTLVEKEQFQNYVTNSIASSGKKSEGKSEIDVASGTPFGKFNIPTQGMIFGEGGVDIALQGNMDVMLGYNHNTIKNPALSPFQQSQGLLDFDMGMNLAVTGKIGDKFQNTLRYNNQAGFGFEGQQIKLAYNGHEDEIIRNIEAGDVSFDVPTQLVKSANALFGIRTELQFGKLNIKGAISQQRSNRQSKTLENGSETQTFEITCDNYDQNKHFFLSQMFRDNYENAMQNYPVINSPYQITNVEVWVSNRNVRTQGVRDVVAFQDMGEPKPYSIEIRPTGTDFVTSNEANNLYPRIKTDDDIRNGNNAVFNLQANYNLRAYEDFEKAFVRKLSESEFQLNSRLGFISISSNLQPNDILGVSYQYTYKGKIYQVGDLTRDITLPDSTSSEPSRVLYLKLLKGTNVNPSFPVWDLMMKNVYSLNAYQIEKENFRLDVVYNDPGGGLKRYLPEGNLQDQPLIRTVGVDRLNPNEQPYPDGVFDFIEDLTILSQRGKVIFPVLEPFGSHLKKELEKVNNASLVSKYVYQELYDSTQFLAQQFPEKNRYIIKGTYQSRVSNRIPLGFNTPRGSVYVTMNGQRLTEGQDYIVEYGSLGYVELMDHITSSGGQVQIEYENNSSFGLQVKNFMGLRAEYRFNDNFKIGTTWEKLAERPFNNKITYGNDPISNQIWGADIGFSTNTPWLTKILDKIPFYKTDEMSSVTAYGEYARLFPGHYQSIGEEGTIFIDDFEGTSIEIPIGTTDNLWKLASTPQGAVDKDGNELFPESSLHTDLKYGYNRALLSWYNVSQFLYFNQRPSYFDNKILNDVYQRMYRVQDLFPPRNNTSIPNILQTLDLAYFPKERGPYNYEHSNSPTPGISMGINRDGTLKAPKTRWAGIQRSIDNPNFENNNVEFIQFWLLDPFIKNKNNQGDLYFNLGYISEDVLRDSRMAFEHGLSDKGDADSDKNMYETFWGWQPKFPPINQAFPNDDAQRDLQDVGLDGASDNDEKEKFKDFLDKVVGSLSPEAYEIIENDPSSDNFLHYLDGGLISQEKDIIGLHKRFSMTENNTPVTSGASAIPLSNYITPDNEDINKDNTLNENEAYFQYRVELFPNMDVENHPYIISELTSAVEPDEDGDLPRWVQFRIPIRDFNHKHGNIGDFRNIQFMRMFMTNFEDSVILRTAEFSFIRNQWRKFNTSIQEPTDYLPKDNGEESYFDVGVVTLEENSQKAPVNYVTPPGMLREIGLNASATPIELNEKAMRLSFCNLKDGDAKTAFKIIDFDFRRYKSLKMFAHIDNDPNAVNPIQDNDVSVFIRLGSDFKDNYYEYEVPLNVTPPKPLPQGYNDDIESDQRIVWPEENEFDVTLDDLTKAKRSRNEEQFPTNTPYTFRLGERNITVKGNPDLGIVKIAMIGIRNRAINDEFNFTDNDDGMPKCGEVWVNELRLNGLDEEGGDAALASVNVKLADLGNANFSGSYHSVGFGQIHERVNERALDNFYQYNFNTNLQLGKFFPEKIGLQLPFYMQVGTSISQPKFDPFSNDLETINQEETVRNTFGGDSAKNYLNSIRTIDDRFGFNFTNVRIVPQKTPKLALPILPRYFSFTYAYNSIKKSNPFVASDWLRTYHGEVNYNYAAQPKYIEPFMKLFKKKRDKSLDFIKYINFNLIPNNISFTNSLDRMYGTFQQRQLPGESFAMPEQYLKSFTWNRNYGFSYNPMRPLSFNFNASNIAIIDEPIGAIDNNEKRDSIISNLMDWGRTTSYNHAFTLKYTVPFKRVQALNFINTTLNYGAGMNWTTGPQIINNTGEIIQSPQGNILSNNQTIGTNISINMDKLYSKIPGLKTVDIGNRRNNPYDTKEKRQKDIERAKNQVEKSNKQLVKAKEILKKFKEEKKKIKQDTFARKIKKPKIKAVKKKIKNQRAVIKNLRKQISKNRTAPKIVNTVTQPLLAIRDIDFSYNISNNTELPGYTQGTRHFGIDFNQNQQLDPSFVMGSQPGIPLFAPPDKYARFRWLDDFADNGFMTMDSTFNLPFNQSNAKTFTAKMVLEPWKDIRINLNWSSDYTQRYSEFFLYNQDLETFEHLNPLESGSYTYSDINILSSFKEITDIGKSENIEALNENRVAYTEYFQRINPNRINQRYIDPITGDTNYNYYMGYGPLQQDVLLNSFLTTYRGQSAKSDNKVSPFSRVPLPNWKISYNVLTRFEALKKIFQSISLSHGYSSTTTISDFNSEYRYFGGGDITNPVRIDSLNNNFIPFYYIPRVTMSESFSPLIGINVTLKNSMNFRFDYSRTRQVSLSLIDYQLTENNAKSIRIGAGFMAKKIKLPFTNAEGKQMELKNGARFSLDINYQDNIMVNHKLGQERDILVGGAERLMISPKIDSRITDKFNLSIFYNYILNNPKITPPFETINGTGGVKLSFSLTQ